jgi:streptomycin 3"-adenylyltransferase
MLIVTTGPLTLSEQYHMTEVTLACSLKPRPFELSSLALDYLNQWEHPCRYDFHYSKDWREKLSEKLANGALQKWSQPIGKDGDLAGHVMIVRQRGLTLYGVPIHDVFPLIPMEHYQASILSDYHWLLQNDLGNTVYGILNMCRIWQHFSDGAISSKDEGGVWALRNLPDQHHEVVKKALAAYRNDVPLIIDETRYKAFKTFVAVKLESRLS